MKVVTSDSGRERGSEDFCLRYERPESLDCEFTGTKGPDPSEEYRRDFKVYVICEQGA